MKTFLKIVICVCMATAILAGSIITADNAMAQNKRFDLTAGYTGIYKGMLKGNGVLATLAFDLPVGHGFSFMPEGGLEWQSTDHDWNTTLVLRASAAYSIKFTRTQFTIFTGPRMNTSLFGHTALCVPMLNEFKAVSVAWQFGLAYHFERFVIKGAYSLPISSQASMYGYSVRPHVFELSLGWSFSAE